MSNIEQRQSLYVYQNLTAGNGKFSIKNVDIPFNPDEMIVRQISYDNDSSETGVYSVKCSAVDQVIANFVDPCSVSLNSTFTVKKPIGTSLDFEILFGSNISAGGGDIALILEFIKYKK